MTMIRVSLIEAQKDMRNHL